MSIPVSKYEELLRTVRDLGQEARHVQSLASPLLSSLQENSFSTRQTNINPSTQSDNPDDSEPNLTNNLNRPNIQHKISIKNDELNASYSKSKLYKGGFSMDKNNSSERIASEQQNVLNREMENTERITSSSGPLSNLYHGTWPVDRGWQSGPSSLPSSSNNEVTSVMSFASSAGSTGPFEPTTSSVDTLPTHSNSGSYSGLSTEAQQLGAKVDIVYGLLAMLGANEGTDMGHTLLALSSSPESCLAMRKSGCIPLLVQLVHSECDPITRQQASQALHNLVQAQPDERLLRRETRVLKLLEQIRVYCDTVGEEKIQDSSPCTSDSSSSEKDDKHPAQIIANLMKLSFDEGHRIAICQLGGLQAIAKLIQVDHLVHGSDSEDPHCITLRRYSGMALTNLTFGDGNNKALLCSLHDFMQVLVKQLYSKSEDLKQVTASVLRNLSWRADSQSKQILREAGAVVGLAHAAMNSSKEATLKSVLSALWNLSAHCSINKADICSVDGLLAYLVNMLNYKSPSKTLSIIENAGGILRNISSHIAVREDYRQILREHNCLQILLQQLRSPSLTVVSNACGSLWNLSAKCSTDQKALWDMGAVPMLRSLTHSKHKMISMGSSAALKNLLSARPNGGSLTRLDSTARALGLSALPTLGARKQRALEQELDQNLSETCDNIEPSVSPTTNDKFNFATNELHLGRILASHSYTQGIRRKTDTPLSESRESVTSTQSDSVYERVIRTLPKRNSSPNCLMKTDASVPLRSTSSAIAQVTNKLSQSDTLTNLKTQGKTDLKFIKRYEHSRYEQQSLDSTMWAMKKKLPSTSSTNYVSVRNKFSDCVPEDEQNVSDQPVDYSQKYAEEQLGCSDEISAKAFSNESSPKILSESSKSQVEVAYGNYAVTDLDQPTNYSLRYPEDDNEEEVPNSKTKDDSIYDGTIPEFVHEDTVKTYCTEGTPYETPFNFSNATSMSDLRMEPGLSDEKKIIDNDFIKKEKPPKEHETGNINEKDSCSVEDITKIETDTKFTTNYKSTFSSGILSPEKPVNYCEEGTPGYFSRVSSLSSLNSAAVNDNVSRKEDEKKLEFTPEKCERTVEIVKDSPREENRDRECKVVTFGGAVDYAEETPLMFSRTSSLASLDSVEQHSIHDDRSSVISDFSRRTSGVVSPSELPDSPTQTIPPTPIRPNNQESTSRSRKLGVPARNSTSNLPPSAAKRSVFEDATSSFKDENTPMEFSRATSLSSLTIDDEIKPIKELSPIPFVDDETNKITKQMADLSVSSSPKHGSGIPVLKKISPRSSIPRMRSRPPPPPQLKKQESDIQRVSRNLESSFDAVKTYYTEDTPAVLSHAGSNSNLSELSIPVEDNPKLINPLLNLVNRADTENDLQQPSTSKLDTNINKENTSAASYQVEKSDDRSPKQYENSFESSDIGSNNSGDEINLSANKSSELKNNSDDMLAASGAEDIEDDSSNTSADERLLQQCIQAGVNRVTSTAHMISPIVKDSTSKNSDKFQDDDDAPAFSDDSYTSADERLLQQCIKAGMARVALNSCIETVKAKEVAKKRLKEQQKDKSSIPQRKIPLSTHGSKYSRKFENVTESHLTDKIDQLSKEEKEFSDDGSINSAEEKLLNDCIKLGIERVTTSSINKDDELDLSDDSNADKLLQECIQFGMDRVAKGSADARLIHGEDDDNASITSADERLLAECINLGIQSVTGEKPQISPNFVQQSKKLEYDKPKPEKRNRSIGYNQKTMEDESELKKGEEQARYSSKLKGLSERPVKPVSPPNVSSRGNNMSSTLSLDSTVSLNEAEKALLQQCIQVGITRTTGQSIVETSNSKDKLIRPENRKPIGAENDDLHRSRDLRSYDSQHTLREQNFDNRPSDTIPCPHPAYRESTYTTRVLTSTRENRSNIATRENNPRIVTREEYYNTRVPAFDQKYGTYSTESKNVDAPPVTASTVEVLYPNPHTFHQVTGAESDFVGNEIQRPICNVQDSPIPCPDICGKLQDEHIHHIESSATGETKNGFEQNMTENINDFEQNLFTKDLKKGCNKSLSSLLDESLENNSEIVQSVEINEQEIQNDKTEDNITEFVTCADENSAIDVCTQDQNSDESSLETDDMKYDYCKPRHPDAMIASVDRLTAELVSHASHLQHSDHLMKQSAQDTWNDTSSAADLTFPSISATAPIIVSIKSETDRDVSASELSKENSKEDNYQVDTNPSSLDTNYSAMTDSTIIAAEASKVVSVVQKEAAMVESGTSIGSMDIENVKPPSSMDSLISLTSISGQWEVIDGVSESKERRNSLKGLTRGNSKRKLSSTDMVRRAISNSSNHSGSLENLINQASNSLSNSLNLDCIKPPSIMNDISDMESSMVSVASITSEVAETSQTNNLKPDFVHNGLITTDVFDMQSKITQLISDSGQPQSLFNFIANSTEDCSNIENINPPSYFNDNPSIVDVSLSAQINDNETICDDDTTDIFEDCATHTIDPTLQNDDITEYSDAHSITPIPSDFASSSAESTPKKVNRVNKRLTPKQRRQLTKERFKTYTVAAGMVIQEEQKRNYETQKSCPEYIDSGKGSTIETSDHKDTSSDSSDKKIGKVTPKQRRQEDRQRFQTQVLGTSSFHQLNGNQSDYTSLDTDEGFTNTSIPTEVHVTSEQFGRKTVVKKTLKQKRLEDKERFRTRTIEDVSSSPDSSLPNADSPAPASLPPHLGTDEMHSIIRHEASRIVDKLNENADELLDCETISLVSNEDESEHNSINSVNFRTYHKSWGFSNQVPVIDDTFIVTTSENQRLSLPIVQNGEISNTFPRDDIQNGVENSPSESDHSDQEIKETKSVKPKIVKPIRISRDSSSEERHNEENQEAVKAIRGRRKPLYSSQPKRVSTVPKIVPKNTKTIKTVSSNLVKNVTSNIKSTPVIRKISHLPPKSVNPPVKPVVTNKLNGIKPPSKISFGNSIPKRSIPPPNLKPITRAVSSLSKPPLAVTNESTRNATTSPKTSPVRKVDPVPTKMSSPQKIEPIPTKISSPQKVEPTPKKPTLERQGTFTKEESASPSPSRTKIPLPSSSPSKIAKPVTKPPISKLPKTSEIPKYGARTASQSSIPTKKSLTKSSSVGSPTRPKSVPSTSTSRSPSTERETLLKRRSYGQTSSIDLRNSPSNQNIQAIHGSKLSLMKPNLTQRSYSNSSIPSTNLRKKIPGNSSKEITSKIATLWKKVEVNRNQQQKVKQDTRVWIQNENEQIESSTVTTRLLRSSTFEGVPKNGLPENHLPEPNVNLAETNNASEQPELVNHNGIKKVSRYNTYVPEENGGVPETILDVSMEEDMYISNVVTAT